MQGTIKETIDNLGKNHMAGYYVESIFQLHKLIRNLMPEGQTGVYEYVRNHHYNFWDKHRESLSHEEKREIYLRNFRADTFLTGINAVTVDGKLFNIDGNGSRVAPIIYGPKQVIAVVGTNKIVKSVDHAARLPHYWMQNDLEKKLHVQHWAGVLIVIIPSGFAIISY